MRRLTAEDFRETEGHTLPMVHPPEPQPEPRSVLCGDTPLDRLVIALCIVALVAGLAVLSGCGGGDEDDPVPEANCKAQVAPPINKPTSDFCT